MAARRTGRRANPTGGPPRDGFRFGRADISFGRANRSSVIHGLVPWIGSGIVGAREPHFRTAVAGSDRRVEPGDDGAKMGTASRRGTATAVTFDYVSGFTYLSQAALSSITTYGANGGSSTQYYSGADGTGSAVGAPIVSGGALGSRTSASGAPASDGCTISITGSGKSIDPGTGSQSIQFVAGATSDTVALDPGGSDTIAGFDPSAGDLLDVRSLFAAAKVDVGGASFLISNYTSIAAVGGSAAISFDPSGMGGGSQVASLTDGGGLVARLRTMKAFVV